MCEFEPRYAIVSFFGGFGVSKTSQLKNPLHSKGFSDSKASSELPSQQKQARNETIVWLERARTVVLATVRKDAAPQYDAAFDAAIAAIRAQDSQNNI